VKPLALPAFTGTLLPEHLALIEQIREHRAQIGLSTERCDRPAAEAAVRLAHETAGVNVPPLMIWTDSPLGGVFAAAAASHLFRRAAVFSRSTPSDDRLADEFWGQLTVMLRTRFPGEVGNRLGNQLQEQLGEHPWGRVHSQLDGWLDGGPDGGPGFPDQLDCRLGEHLRSQLRRQLWDQVDSQLDDKLCVLLDDALDDPLPRQRDVLLRDQLRDHLRDQVWSRGNDDQVAAQHWPDFCDQLWQQLDGNLWDQLWDQVGAQINNQLGPWWEAERLAFYTAAIPIAGLPANPGLDALVAAVDSVGWWWPMRGAVILSDRPTAVHLETTDDGRTRPHCETGPAVSYADGYGLWAWHGTRVPPELIETGWDGSRILREPAADLRGRAIGREAVTFDPPSVEQSLVGLSGVLERA
jgi:hypothetical protein